MGFMKQKSKPEQPENYQLRDKWSQRLLRKLLLREQCDLRSA